MAARTTSVSKRKPIPLMGETHAEITVSKQRRARKKVPVRCVVDTGADLTVLPRDLLLRLGIEPDGRQPFWLANGQAIERDVGEVFVEFGDSRATTQVMFGEPGDASLLGVITLEQLGLGVDTLRRQLIPLKRRA